MSFVRAEVIKCSMYPTFRHLVNYLASKIRTNYPNTMVHVVFYSYISRSLKAAERRGRGSDGILGLAKIDENTKVPTQMDKFWASSANKVHLQKLFAGSVFEMAKQSNFNIVFSGTVVGEEPQPCTAIIEHQEQNDIVPLRSMIEEADSRMILHINWSVTFQKYKNFVVLSNDTDVLVLILHYFKQFKHHGIEKLWIRMGTGASKRLIPIHHLYQRMPRPLVKVLLAAHFGTGCDTLSKLGTKLAALNTIPEMYLEGFGIRVLDDI